MVSAKVFTEILNEIEKQLPPTMQMLSPISTKFINLYFEQATVRSYTDNEKILIITKIPLIVYTDIFDLFNIYTIPHYNPDIKKFIMWDLPQQIAVSIDHSNFFIPENQDLTCKNNEIQICQYAKLLFKFNKP